MTPTLALFRAIVLQASSMFMDLLPYVLAGAALGAALRRASRFPFSEQLLSWSPQSQIILAAIAGTVSPLCTLGTVPLLLGMVGRGYPAPAALAFLGASSMTNPQMLVLTAGTLGMRFAVITWAAAIAVGVSSGALALWAAKKGQVVFKPAVVDAESRMSGHKTSQDGHHRRSGRSFWQAFLDNLEFVALYLVVGVLLAAALNVLVPERYLMQWLGQDNPFAVIVSALLAMPFYVCGGGILPVMQVLTEKGLPPGVVVAFFISGPATRIQALSALAALLKARALAIYVGLVLAWAVGLGMLLNVLSALT